MKRTPMAPRKVPMNRGSGRLKPMSDKRRAERPARLATVEAAMRDAGSQCTARLIVPEIECWGPLDVDEVAPRGIRPGGHIDQSNVQVLCRAHHDWKHAYPQEAHDRGLRKWSWED